MLSGFAKPIRLGKISPKTMDKKVMIITIKVVAKAPSKVDEKLMHQIDWLTRDVVNGYFMGVESDILSKAEIKALMEKTHDHQEIFDYLSVDKNTSAVIFLSTFIINVVPASSNFKL